MLKKISIYLIGILPLGLIAGPLIAELILFFIFIFFSVFLFKEKNLELFNNKIFKIFLIFWSYIVILSFFATDFYASFKSSFFYLRFGLYTIAIVYFLKSYHKSLELIYIIYKLTLIFVIFDSAFQIFYGKDFFRLTTNSIDLARISGPFGDSFILGSFLQKILPVYIYLILKNYNKNKKILIFDYLILIFVFVLIYRSGDRSALGLISFFSILFFIINKTFRKNMINIFGFATLISFLFTLQNPKIFERNFTQTINQFKGKYYENFLEKDLNETNLNFMIFSFHHQTHYSTALRMFIDKPIFGHGLKMFRYECENYSYKPTKNDLKKYKNLKKSYGCTTHPHNTYIQLLSESGLIGFMFIFILLCYLLKKISILLIKKEKSYIPESALLIGIFINLWPIIPTGSFFNNWISIIYYIPISYYIYDINKK